MKTTIHIAMITAAMTFGFAGDTFASTPGKHAVDEAGPHMHLANCMASSSKGGGYSSGGQQAMFKNLGAPGKTSNFGN